MQMFQQIVLPAGKSCQCIKNAVRTIGSYRKVCFTCLNSDVFVIISDQGHRDEVIRKCSRTGCMRKPESVASCILNWMM